MYYSLDGVLIAINYINSVIFSKAIAENQIPEYTISFIDVKNDVEMISILKRNGLNFEIEGYYKLYFLLEVLVEKQILTQDESDLCMKIVNEYDINGYYVMVSPLKKLKVNYLVDSDVLTISDI